MQCNTLCSYYHTTKYDRITYAVIWYATVLMCDIGQWLIYCDVCCFMLRQLNPLMMVYGFMKCIYLCSSTSTYHSLDSQAISSWIPRILISASFDASSFFFRLKFAYSGHHVVEVPGDRKWLLPRPEQWGITKSRFAHRVSVSLRSRPQVNSISAPLEALYMTMSRFGPAGFNMS
jgi:hypothetical protein